jgi:hypothetical protein
MNDEEMKQEYDFSKGERGKFHRPNARVHIPVYLEEGVLGSLTEIAQRKGVEVDALVNDVLKKELAIAEALR